MPPTFCLHNTNKTLREAIPEYLKCGKNHLAPRTPLGELTQRSPDSLAGGDGSRLPLPKNSSSDLETGKAFNISKYSTLYQDSVHWYYECCHI